MSEHEHTKTDGLGEMLPVAGGDATDTALGQVRLAAGWATPARNERMAAHKIECNACPVLCQISDGKVGACDRYANQGGLLVRVDPVLWLRRHLDGDTSVQDGGLVPFLAPADAGAGGAASTAPEPADAEIFVTAVGASTTYPDYKPAPFIVSSVVDGVDMVTVVTEGIFSYCRCSAWAVCTTSPAAARKRAAARWP